MTEMNRREFLKVSGLAAAAGLAHQASGQSQEVKNKVEGMPYRIAGKTGLSLSVITLGGTRPSLLALERGLEHGINMFHTAKSYENGKSLECVGKVAKTKRDRFYLALKDDFPYDKLDEMLKILNTDHVDFILFNRHNPEAASDPKIKEQFETWKAQGKVRFCGLTAHDKVVETMEKGIESGMYDAVMPTYSPTGMAQLAKVLSMAEAKNISFFPMKTLNGLAAKDMQDAQLRKVLDASKAIPTIIKSAVSVDEVDQYVAAVKAAPQAREQEDLSHYTLANLAMGCRMCGACTGACPIGIACATLVRCVQHYHDQQGSLSDARHAYASLHENGRGRSCTSCGACDRACPNGVKVSSYVSRAVALLDRQGVLLA